MSDYTTTPNYGLYKPTPNADVDLWGDHLNANADKLDQVIRDIAVASGGGAGGGRDIWITDFLPAGQPDGSTDLASYFQQALDTAAGADPANRAAAPGVAKLIVPANQSAYIIGASLYIPSNSHIIIEHGATLKLAPQTNANMFLLCNFAHHVLIELYGTLDGNSSQQFFKQNSPGVSPPPTDMPGTSISGGISNDRIWGGPTRNPVVQGGFCSHVKITGDRNGLITNFQNGTVGLNAATNCEISGISMTNSAFHAGSVGVSGWRNFPYNTTTGVPLTFTGTYVAATNTVTLTTSVPHCMVPGEEFITEFVTGSSGSYNCATGKLFIALPGTAGNTIVYSGAGGGTDAVITGGRITNWYYQQATIVSGTYVPATGVITVTTTAPHQLVYAQTISSNITGGTAAAIATGIFQLLDVTDGAGAPPISDTKATTLRYRTTRTGTTENIVSGVYDSLSGIVTLTTDAPHGMSSGDVVTVSATGSGFLQTLNAEQVCIAGTAGTTIKYVTLPGLTSIVISGGTVYGGATLMISAGTIGVSTKCWNSGFDNCFIDQIRDIGPCIYGGGVACYIRNSEVTRNLGSGPYLFSDQNSGRCVDCEISGNYIHDNLGAGVGTVNFGTGNIPHTGTRIFNNYITGNRGGAGFSSCDGLECADNYFYKNRAVGLNTYGSVGEIAVGPYANRVSITGNTLRDPCLISTTMAGTTLTQVASGTYNNATGAVSLTTAIPHNLFGNAYFTLSATTGTGAYASIEGRYTAEASTGPTILNFHAPAGLGTITITGGQLVPNGFGIVTHGADRLYIADNFIADYQSPPTMLAAIGGTWGIQGVCTGNYYGPRINSGGNFPADMSAGGMQGNNFDVVTGFTNGTTLHQPFSNDSAERFAPLGVQVGYNRSAGRGESNIYVGAGNASPGGFDFIKVIGISVQAPSSYDPATAIVTLTTRTPHGLVVGSRFNLSLVLGTDSIGFTDGRDISKLGGNWIATADNAGTSGTTINFVLTQNVLGVPTPYTGLDILTITAGAINASALDSGVIDTSVGLPVTVSNSGTLGFTTGGSLLAVDGYANTRLGGALVHGAIQTATLANGGTVTVNPNTSFVLVQNASSIATGSVVLPAPQGASYQLGGSDLEVRFSNPVGTLTMTAAPGAGVAGPPTAVLSAGSSFRFVLSEPGNIWLPRLPDVSGTAPVGGPYLPLSGGAVTGATTFGGLTTHAAGVTVSGGTLTAGTASLTGAATLGSASTNYVQITGAASNPLITVTGAGTNGALLLQSQGHGAINLRSATGGLITQFADGSTTSVGNYLIISAKNAGTAVTLAATDATAGLSLVGPMSINRAWAYSGNWSVANSVLSGQWTITGTATDSSATPLNYLLTTDNLLGTTNATLTHFALRAQIGAASAGPRNTAQTAITQTAQTANFAHGLVPNYTAHQFNATASFNEGGTAGVTNSRGAIWGQTIGTLLNSGATYFGGVIGTEYDMVINTGASASKVASISITGPGNARGTYLTTGIAFAGNVNTGAASLEHGINFSDGSWGDTAFGNTSSLLYAEYSTASGVSLPIGWFADMLAPTFAGGFLRSKGFSVDGTGTMQIGTGLLKALSTGLAIDATGAVGTGTPTVAAGGAGFAPLNIIKDSYGGIYQVTSVTGSAIATLTVVVQPSCPAAPPSNPVSVSCIGTGDGTGATLNLTWDTSRTTLALQPSGGPLTVAGNASFIGGNTLTVSGGGGTTTISNGLLTTVRATIAGNVTAATTVTPALFSNIGTFSGSVSSGIPSLNSWIVSSDTATSNRIVNTLGITHNASGAGLTGGRALLSGQLTVSSGITGPNQQMIGSVMTVIAATGAHAGTILTPFNVVGHATAGATGLGGIVTGEFDILAEAGSTVGAKAGVLVVLGTGDAVAGTQEDSGFNLTNANAAGISPGLRYGLQFSQATQGWPINPTTGTIIGAKQQTAYKNANRTVCFPVPSAFAGVDFWNVDFAQASGVAFRSGGFSVDGTGHIVSGNALIGTTATGVAVDVPSQIVTGATIAAGGGGGGGGTNDYYVGDILFDASGGQYRVATVTTGAVATVTMLVPGVAASPPANPVTTTGGSGINCTLTLTWSATRNGLSLNPTGQKIGFNGTAPIAKPTGWGASPGGVRAAITASSTLPQVAAGLAQLLNDLTAYGLIGT